MNSKAWKYVSVGVVILMLVFSVACGATNSSKKDNTASNEEKKKELTFGMVYSLATPFYNACDVAAKDKEKELGIKVIIEKPEKADVGLQVKSIENFIAQGVDGLIVNVVGEGVTPIINEAINKGIPVMTMAIDAANSKRIAYFGSDQSKYGSDHAEYIAKMLGEKGNVLAVAGVPTSPDMIARTEAFKQQIAKYPNMKILDLQFGYSDPAKTLAILENMFQASKDVNAVVAFNASAGGPLAAVVKQVGKGKMKVLADHDNPDTIKGIREGNVDATQVQKPYKMAAVTIQTLYDYIVNGKKVENPINYIETIFLTKDNIESNYDKDNKRINEYK